MSVHSLSREYYSDVMSWRSGIFITYSSLAISGSFDLVMAAWTLLKVVKRELNGEFNSVNNMYAMLIVSFCLPYLIYSVEAHEPCAVLARQCLFEATVLGVWHKFIFFSCQYNLIVVTLLLAPVPGWLNRVCAYFVFILTASLCGDVATVAAAGISQSISDLLPFRWDDSRGVNHTCFPSPGPFCFGIWAPSGWKSTVLLSWHCV